MNKQYIITKIIRQREKQKQKLEQKGFDTSSIGDLAFLLLIFFIVTASFIVRQGIFFSLPSKNSRSIKIEKSQIIEVYPLNEGFLYNGKIIQRKELKNTLRNIIKQYAKPVVFIRMKPDVRYEKLVDMLSICRELGIKRISLKDPTDNFI